MEMNFDEVPSLQTLSKVNQTHFKKDGNILEKVCLLSIQPESTSRTPALRNLKMNVGFVDPIRKERILLSLCKEILKTYHMIQQLLQLCDKFTLSLIIHRLPVFVCHKSPVHVRQFFRVNNRLRLVRCFIKSKMLSHSLSHSILMADL